MNVIICDICRRCIVGNDPSKDATMRMKDLFLSRTFVVFNPVDESIRYEKELTLCSTCKETMYYFMQNRDALNENVQRMGFINRVRFLFKKPLKIKEAETVKEVK